EVGDPLGRDGGGADKDGKEADQDPRHERCPLDSSRRAPTGRRDQLAFCRRTTATAQCKQTSGLKASGVSPWAAPPATRLSGDRSCLRLRLCESGPGPEKRP